MTMVLRRGEKGLTVQPRWITPERHPVSPSGQADEMGQPCLQRVKVVSHTHTHKPAVAPQLTPATSIQRPTAPGHRAAIQLTGLIATDGP